MTDVRVSQDAVESISEETNNTIRDTQHGVETGFKTSGDIRNSQNGVEVFEFSRIPIRLTQMAFEVIYKDSGDFINIFVVT